MVDKIIELKGVWVLLSAKIFFLIMLHDVFITAYSSDGSPPVSIILFTLAVIYINFIVFWYFEKIKSSYEYRHEKEMIESKFEFQRKYYELLEAQQQETQALWHDMQKHILAIKELYRSGMPTEAESYIATVEQNLSGIPNAVRTNIPAINAILADELRKAKANDIDIRLDINISQEIKIQPFDLCVMLGNSVENAIDACSVLPDGTLRFIDIKILQDNMLLLIDITNPYGSASDSLLRAGRINGYGLKNIRKTVKKYGGDIEIKNADNIFQLSIVIAH